MKRILVFLLALSPGDGKGGGFTMHLLRAESPGHDVSKLVPSAKGTAKWLYGIYLSSDFQCRKPDLRFYRALLEEQKLDVANCLMIGNDRNTDIAGAMAAGMATLYMHTNITPPGQKEADPALLPGNAAAGCRHFEFEGSDWSILTELIMSL